MSTKVWGLDNGNHWEYRVMCRVYKEYETLESDRPEFGIYAVVFDDKNQIIDMDRFPLDTPLASTAENLYDLLVDYVEAFQKPILDFNATLDEVLCRHN